MKKSFLLTFLLLGSCASHYENGVSVWRQEQDIPEVIETQEYESYVVVEESEAEPTTLMKETEVVALAENPEQISMVSSSSRPVSSTSVISGVTGGAVTEPSSVMSPTIVDGGKCFANLFYPAKYVTNIQKQALAPESYELVTLPAEYRWTQKVVTNKFTGQSSLQTVREIVKPARQLKRLIPAEYDISRAGGVVYEEAKTQLSRVICKDQLSFDLLSQLQGSLSRAGYNTGGITGQINSQTLQAMSRYQQAHGLATGGLTLDTLNSLGIYSYTY